MKITSIAVPLGAAALLFAACAPASTPVEAKAAGVTNIQPEGPEGVTSRIAVARCAREATCGHVGPGRTYATRRDCEDALLPVTKTEVGACLQYDGWMLDQCTTDIHAARCADPMPTVGASIVTCNMRRLCHVPDSP
jgi:hypothetical protein